MRVIFLLLISLLSYKCYAQTSPDLLIGKWLKTPKEDLIIEVYKVKNEYRGKITWAKDSSKGKHIGFQILEGLKYNATSNIWSDGEIRSPRSGSTYSAIAKIRTDGMLEVLAYKGMKFFGRKKYFRRVK
jgi:opacity protein-like surface antigen